MKTLLLMTLLTLPIFGSAVEFACGDGSYSGAELCNTYDTCDSHCSGMGIYTVWENSSCNCWYEADTPGEQPKEKHTTERQEQNYYW